MIARKRDICRLQISSSTQPFLKFIFVSLLLLSLSGCTQLGMLSPQGIITYEERKLFFDTFALMLIVVLPVIVMSFTFIYHYQASHNIKDYKPKWAHSYLLESLWWGIPCAIIVILAVLTWKKTHELDPYNKIAGYNQQPILIQVIALPWKWLFVYPQFDIATINYLVVPVGQQIEYWMTCDNVPMSALFIPQLGSQIYAMAGMRTRLYLVANRVGVLDGMNTQYNGGGFSDMHFPVYVMEAPKFQQWVAATKKSTRTLNTATYQQLLTPSIPKQPEFFSGVDKNLFLNVVTTYMNTFGSVHPRQQFNLPDKKQE